MRNAAMFVPAYITMFSPGLPAEAHYQPYMRSRLNHLTRNAQLHNYINSLCKYLLDVF
jgi:hypothetical protein